jgi:hypothetical protein
MQIARNIAKNTILEKKMKSGMKIKTIDEG